MVHSDHRLLVVSVRQRGCSAHWLWSMLKLSPKRWRIESSTRKGGTPSLAASRGEKNVILLIDINAHVGSEVSEHVGCGGCAQDQNFNGVSFHDVLRIRLCPNTFEEFDPQKYTRTCHRTATHHRNDYIAVPLEWAADSISSAVLEDIDTGAANVDHYPVMLELESVASSCGQGLIRSFPGFIWTGFRHQSLPKQWILRRFCALTLRSLTTRLSWVCFLRVCRRGTC